MADINGEARRWLTGCSARAVEMIALLHQKRKGIKCCSSASAPKEHVLLCAHLFLGKQGLSFKSILQNQAIPGNMCKKCFQECGKLPMLLNLAFLIYEQTQYSFFHMNWNDSISRQECMYLQSTSVINIFCNYSGSVPCSQAHFPPHKGGKGSPMREYPNPG